MTDRYTAAAHRVQTAIGFNPDKTDQEPKHLRVGIDMGKADTKGLVELLIAKGVFTVDEYLDAITTSAESEADMHERELSEKFGLKVKTV